MTVNIENVEERVLASPNLPSIPHVAAKLIQLASNPDVTVKQLSRCVAADPALVQRLLRTVNSPLFRVSSKVSRISHAVSMLGVNGLRGLVLGLSLPRRDAHANDDGFSLVTYWRHSLANAVISKLLAESTGQAPVEEAFVAGLLAEIGVLALYIVMPQVYSDVLRRREERLAQIAPDGNLGNADGLTSQIEQEVLGTDHARIGGRLLSQWGLPDALAIPIRCHHAPDEIDGDKPQMVALARMLHLATFASQAFYVGGALATLDKMTELAQAHFRLEQADIERMLSQVAEEVTTLADLFEVDVGGPIDSEALLQHAHDRLVDLSVENAVAAQRESRLRAQAERRANRLETLRERLAERANRDAMTGVFNRGFLDRVLARQFEQNRLTGSPIGLIITDVHHFKDINDTLGHQQGDAVLKELARRLQANTRDTDAVARYGGDEFVIVMPDADVAMVRTVALRIRAAVRDQPFPTTAGEPVHVALGIGAVAVSDCSRFTGYDEVLKIADRVLYATKRERVQTIYLVQV